MKRCFKCKLEKEENEFVKNQNRCKSCNSEYVMNHYKKCPRYKTDIIERANSLKKRTITMITKFKENYGCALCAENDPCCLEFHHLDPKTKLFEISGTSKRSVESYRKEMIKCEIVCTNCHKKIHAGKTVLNNRRELDLSLLKRENTP